MSKGVYSIIAYPESCDIGNLTNLLSGMGAEYKYILHDRDFLEDGSHKKDHYHILCGWQNHFPDWAVFKKAVQSVGAVALSLQKCLVRDLFKVEEYLIHANDPHKFQYSPWYVISSDGWDISAYESANAKREREREAKKADKTDQTFQVISLIEEFEFTEMAELTLKIATEYRQYRDILIEKHSYFDSYLRSKRNWFERRQKLILRIEELEKQVQKLEEVNKKLTSENVSVSALNAEYRRKLIELSNQFDTGVYDFDF